MKRKDYIGKLHDCKHNRLLGKGIRRNNSVNIALLKDLDTIKSMSQEEKVYVFQQLEVNEGIRMEVAKTTAPSMKCVKIVNRFNKMPNSRKAQYAVRIKKQLYDSIISSIDSKE